MYRLCEAIRFEDLEDCEEILSGEEARKALKEPSFDPPPLVCAARTRNAAICGLLLDRGATHAPDSRGETPLHAAASAGSIPVCELLLKRGADLEARDSAGRTPLHHARDLAVCSFLLDRGATHTPGASGLTPLAWAVLLGRREVCRLLLERGATHELDCKGETPLFMAASLDRPEICKLLLAHGARNVCNDSGRTPLLNAAARRRFVTLRTLLLHLCSPPAEDAESPSDSWAAAIRDMDLHTRAMLSLREPALCLYKAHHRISSFAGLIFWVQTHSPAEPRVRVLREAFEYSRASFDFETAEIVFLLLDGLPSPRIAFGKGGQIRAAVRGNAVRRAWKNRRRDVSQLGLPCWAWREILMAGYGIPEAWTSDQFWEGPCVPCRGAIPLLA